MTSTFRALAVVMTSVATVSTANSRARAQTVEAHRVEIITAEDVGLFRPTHNADLQRAAELIERLTNDFRAKHGREPVKSNDKLEQTAADFAEYMAHTGRYGHYATGEAPSERVKEHGYEYCISAENIAYDFQTTGFSTQKLAESIVAGWENSPEHRENMLLPGVTHTGVAVAQSEETGVYFAVQEFGRPKSAAIDFQLANRAAETIRYKLSDQGYVLPPRFIRSHTICWPEDLMLLDGKDTVATLHPSNGDRFTIVEEAGRLRLQRERE
jgi:uncharacterized protein YkwD